MRVPRLSVAAGVGAVMLTLLLAPVAATAFADAGPFHHDHWRGDGHVFKGHGTVVSLESSPYGPVLVVGGGGAGYDPSSPYADPAGYLYPAGSSLYAASIDPPAFGAFGRSYMAGCDATTQAVSVLEGGPETCAGSATDPTADWPALTTDGAPVAGRGVNRWLLGAVYRADLGTFQVTYAGHPLYLFDPGPESFAGEDFFETVGPILYPWHTAWYLVSPAGEFNPGPANLSVLTPQSGADYSGNVLAVEMLPNIGLPDGVPVAVYTFSRDRRGHSTCYGACAREFIPVTTLGAPAEQAGVDTGAVGVIRRLDGSLQVTYHGHPLYIYNQEQPLVLGPTDIQSVGNGAGVTAFGGTLTLVNP
jgi:predicted lipoprotein with Yx(FWY)xxD motif